MTRLLGAFRRERNGLVADTMHYDGARYGLNYGVSLTTVRRLVRELEPERDEKFARFLLSQQVRCLQLSALHLADSKAWQGVEDTRVWLEALTNSELAEEAAYALFGRLERLGEWMNGDFELLPLYAQYGLLMAAARHTKPCAAWLDVAYQAAARHEHRLFAQATVALWAHSANSDETTKKVVLDRLQTLGTTSLDTLLRDELAWRIL